MEVGTSTGGFHHGDEGGYHTHHDENMPIGDDGSSYAAGDSAVFVDEHGHGSMVSGHMASGVALSSLSAGGMDALPMDYSQLERKPYLGGYRDKRTGKEYHHGFTQTPYQRVSKWEGKAPRFERETQTTDQVTRSVQSKREGVAQTGRHDLLLDTAHDVEVTSRKYFTAAQLHAVKDAKALVIQCHWRGYMARKRALEIRHRLESQRQAALEEARRKAQEEEARFAKDVERRLHPRTTEDFAILYDEVEAWRASETAKIKTNIPDEETQKEALTLLLQKETALLGNIERLRTAALKINAETSVVKKMEKMAAPKVWTLSDGNKAFVHTPYTTRAQELKALYDGLAMDALPSPDRIELLLHIRNTVMEFECALTKDIVSLIDRETELRQRGRPPQSMVGIKQRLKTLFLTFIQTPEFNPEATRYTSNTSAATLKTKCLNTTLVAGGHGLGSSSSSGSISPTATAALHSRNTNNYNTTAAAGGSGMGGTARSYGGGGGMAVGSASASASMLSAGGISAASFGGAAGAGAGAAGYDLGGDS
jgi:IQ calmodulin-binding motif